MQVESTTELAMPARLVEDALTSIPSREMAALVSAATSSGETLLERSGLSRLDAVCECHFGVQLGRPVKHDSMTTLQLRWWNDRSRSLTPGFIGELRIHDGGGESSELTISGEYHPRAHLYELVNAVFLRRMAKAVVTGFLARLKEQVKDAVATHAA